MERALIISQTEKSAAFFKEFLTAASITQIKTLRTCGEARRLLLERSYDLAVVNAPLQDETGEDFSRYTASKGDTQVILAVKSEHFIEVSAACEGYGVLTVSKPIGNAILWSALSLAKAMHGRIKRVRDENAKLRQKIEDIRVIDRAKLILITYMNISEKEAHRYIEKQAMDLRLSRRAVAEGILKTYGE